MTLPLTVNETLKRLSLLPILIHASRSGADGVGLATVCVFHHLLGSRSPPVPLPRQLGVRHVCDSSLSVSETLDTFVIRLCQLVKR